jgi:hypothetical protein
VQTITICKLLLTICSQWMDGWLIWKHVLWFVIYMHKQTIHAHINHTHTTSIQLCVFWLVDELWMNEWMYDTVQCSNVVWSVLYVRSFATSALPT